MEVAVEVETPPATTRSVVVEKHLARRRLGRVFWLAFVVVPLALAAFIGWSQGPVVEDALTDDARGTLAAEGIQGVQLEADGRQLVAKVPTGRDPETVEDVLAAVPGVLTVHATEVYASTKEARACAGLQAKMNRATHRQQIPFSGESARLTGAGEQMLRDAAGLLRDCRAGEVIVGGHVASATVDGATLSLERARVMIRFLKQQGVRSEQMEPRGYGTQFPIAEGDGKAARARNQRGSISVEDQ